MSDPNCKSVFVVAERGHGRQHWLRVGTAFPNDDGSIDLQLDAMPRNGRLSIRDGIPPQCSATGGPCPHPREAGTCCTPEIQGGDSDQALVAVVLGWPQGRAEQLLSEAGGVQNLPHLSEQAPRPAGVTRAQAHRLQAAVELGRRALAPKGEG